MARVLDANAMFAGGEPKFTEEMTRIQLIESLNWYSSNRDYKDAIKYIGDYLNKKLKLKVPERIIKKQTTTFGWVCRLLYNGATLPQENQKYFNDTLETIKKGDGQVDEIVEDVTVVATVNPSIQDRIKESTSRIIAELDGLVDDFTLNAYRETKTPKGMMTELSTKGVHVKAIVEHYKKVRSEISDAIAKRYVCFSKIMPTGFEFFDQISGIKFTQVNFNFGSDIAAHTILPSSIRMPKVSNNLLNFTLYRVVNAFRYSFKSSSATISFSVTILMSSIIFQHCIISCSRSNLSRPLPTSALTASAITLFFIINS